MKRTNLLTILSLSSCLLFSCCKDDNEVKPGEEAPKESSMEMYFDSRYGSEDFELSKQYTTANNDKIKIETLGYYISNVELIKADGSTYKESNSYHLIWLEGADIRETFKIKNVPADNYTKIRFMVGIDSVQNAKVPGPGKGDNHMNWMWTTSYIFYAANGFYEDPAKNPTQQKFGFEIGHNRSMRVVELELPNATHIDDDHNPKVHIYADQKVPFGGPNVIDIKATPNIKGSPLDAAASNLVADNYATMFKVHGVN